MKKDRAYTYTPRESVIASCAYQYSFGAPLGPPWPKNVHAKFWHSDGSAETFSITYVPFTSTQLFANGGLLAKVEIVTVYEAWSVHRCPLDSQDGNADRELPEPELLLEMDELDLLLLDLELLELDEPQHGQPR